MGLIRIGDSWVTLTDILGSEDAFGDMDFKVAGTTDFITALQLDTKISGIPASVLADALRQAYEARLDILDVMAATLMEPRQEVRSTAPKIVTFEIPLDKIGEVIGPKGKMINSIQAETGTDISVDDDGDVGIVFIASTSQDAVTEAERQINLLLNPPSAEVGASYQGRVVNITKFGAFINILPGRDGLLHISKIGGSQRIARVEDVLSLGDEIEVIVEDIDPSGRISLLPSSATDTVTSNTQTADSSSKTAPATSQSRAPATSQSRKGHNAVKGKEHSSARSRNTSELQFMSFEDAFDAELRKEFGDLGPQPPRTRHSRSNRRSRSGRR